MHRKHNRYIWSELMCRINLSYRTYCLNDLNKIRIYKRDPNAPVHAANLVANIGNTSYGVESIKLAIIKYKYVLDLRWLNRLLMKSGCLRQHLKFEFSSLQRSGKNLRKTICLLSTRNHIPVPVYYHKYTTKCFYVCIFVCLYVHICIIHDGLFIFFKWH